VSAAAQLVVIREAALHHAGLRVRWELVPLLLVEVAEADEFHGRFLAKGEYFRPRSEDSRTGNGGSDNDPRFFIPTRGAVFPESGALVPAGPARAPADTRRGIRPFFLSAGKGPPGRRGPDGNRPSLHAPGLRR